MIFQNIKELEEIVKNNDIKKAKSLIKPTVKTNISNTKKRSALMVSGHMVKHLNKIDEIPADIIILNLEDGVPEEKKEIARYMIAIFLTHYQNPNKELIIRINPLNKTGKEEIEFFKNFNFNGFRIPKVNTLEDIDDLFLLEKDLHISVETKEIFVNLKDFKHNKIKAFYLGLYDLLNELNISHSIIKHDNPFIHKILSDFSFFSNYNKIHPIGFVYQHYKDLQGFSKWCLLQKDMGIKGVGCITPSQVNIANKIFSEDLEFAKMIVEKFEKLGPFTIDGLYVDEPIYKNYKQMLY